MTDADATSGNNWDDLYGDLYGDDDIQSASAQTSGNDAPSAGAAAASAPAASTSSMTGPSSATTASTHGGATTSNSTLPANPSVGQQQAPLGGQQQQSPSHNMASANAMQVDNQRAANAQKPDATDEGMIMRDAETGRSRGFAFLTYEDPKSVDAVLSKGREHFLDGKLIDPKRAVPRHEAQKSDKLFVRALPATCTPDSFTAHWRQFGNVTDATLMMDKETGRHRGFGFVNYDSRETVEKVLAAAPHYMDGQLLEVKRAQTKGEARRPDYGVNTNQFMMNNAAPGPVMNPHGPAAGAFDPQAMSKMFSQMGWAGWNPMMMGGMMGGVAGMGGMNMNGMNMNGMGGMGFGGMPGMMGMPPPMGMSPFGGPGPGHGPGPGDKTGGDGSGMNPGPAGSPWTGPMHQPMRGGGGNNRGGFRGGAGGRGGHFNPPTGPASMRAGSAGAGNNSPDGGQSAGGGGNNSGSGGSGTGPQRNRGAGAGFHPYSR
ncbi:hypothetical protein OIO90_004416 [Microbotryomycetes sp. JL221]|nr:hypothetical protein OIO90_004416 [Microbotryomycetes sp. JL221]